MLLTSLLLAAFGQTLKWEPPFHVVTPPQGVPALAPGQVRITEENNRLTIVENDQPNPIELPWWLPTSYVKVGDSEWALQLDIPHADQIFFNYKVHGKEHAFYGRHAPHPNSATFLRGSLETIFVPSKWLGDARGVTVYLPPNAEDAPALNTVYMTDGQSCEEFARVLEPLILAGKVAPTAIVGLHYGPYVGKADSYDMGRDFRAREYLKMADPDRFAAYEKFVSDEVMPLVERRYRLTPGRNHRLLFGYSNGGAYVALSGAEQPERFGAILACSVAAFDRKDFAQLVAAKRPTRFFLASGTLEVFSRNTHDAAEILRKAHAPLEETNYVSGHETLMWEEALAQVLPKVFPG